MIQMGFFSTGSENNLQGQKRLDAYEDDIIPQRERLTVMGAILHPIDNRNYMATVAIVDKFGDLQCHKDFLHLVKPRTRKAKNDGTGQQMRQQTLDESELKKHEEAKMQLREILSKYRVDLIVVCADSLEARRLKQSLSENAKYNLDYSDNQDEDQNKNGEDQNSNEREALVIWGRPEIPKLFASSHYS